MNNDDFPITRRKIDYTGWDLVFTTKGRYFFHDTVERHSKWSPPENLFEYLKDMPSEQLEILFDPDALYESPEDGIEDGVEYSQSDNVYKEEDTRRTITDDDDNDNDNDNENDNRSIENDHHLKDQDVELDQVTKVNLKTATSHPVFTLCGEERQEAITSFEQLLLESNIDPFATWSMISQQLEADSRFIAIPTDKDRKIIFDRLCPELTKRVREKRRIEQEEAQRAWKQCLSNLTLAIAPATWVEFSKSIKKETWFKLLDSKVMEKEYRNRLNELTKQSIVYQIPK